ncbi:MAG: hypothetical protein AAFV46_12450 [Cyanobacteria bacterium J06635_11]
MPLADTDNLAERKARVHSGKMVKAISSHDLATIGQELSNDLEKVVLPAHPKVTQLKAVMTAASQQHSGLGTMMSGSGPTVFSLCETAERAQAILRAVRDKISDPDLQLFAVPFSSYGIETKGM